MCQNGLWGSLPFSTQEMIKCPLAHSRGYLKKLIGVACYGYSNRNDLRQSQLGLIYFLCLMPTSTWGTITVQNFLCVLNFVFVDFSFDC